MPSSGRQSPDAYSAIFVAEGYAALAADFVRAYDFLELSGYANLAAILRRAYLRLTEDVTKVAREIAVKAREYIVEEEVHSRVRPDTGGDQTGKRLEDFLGESSPLVDVPGSVGVNYEPALYDNVPWWWTNEEGYSGHVGRVVHGFFFDAGYTGASRPDPSAFREHPLFRAEGPQRPDNGFGSATQGKLDAPSAAARGTRPGMLIKNPIPQREFVLRGMQRAEAEWHAGIKAAKARFEREIVRVLTLMKAVPVVP